FDVLGPMPYLAQQTMLDAPNAPGTKAYMKGRYLDGLSDEACAVIHEHTGRMPPGMSLLTLIQMGGAVARVPADATAFGGRSAPFQTFAHAVWEDDSHRAAAVAWPREYAAAMEPFSRGAYVNLCDDVDEALLRRTYGADTFARLQRIKKLYDPGNVFRHNQNIPPASSAAAES